MLILVFSDNVTVEPLEKRRTEELPDPVSTIVPSVNLTPFCPICAGAFALTR